MDESGAVDAKLPRAYYAFTAQRRTLARSLVSGSSTVSYNHMNHNDAELIDTSG